MKLFSVILIFCVTACLLILNSEIYLGFMLMAFTYLTLIIQAASSVRGDFSKTAIEIKQHIKSQAKVDFDYLTYHEQLAVIEERRKQGVADRKRKSAAKNIKAKRARRLYRRSDNTNSSFDTWDDDFTTPHAINGVFDDDDYFIDTTIDDSSSFEMPIINVSTGLPIAMLSNGCSGMAGVDVGGHMWGESDSFDNSINDSFSSFDDSFSSFDDSSCSFDDSSDIASCGMDEW